MDPWLPAYARLTGAEEKRWDDKLTGSAHDVAAAEASPLKVVAGPGTGKTFALKRRVARSLQEGCQPKHILAVTFTRMAVGIGRQLRPTSRQIEENIARRKETVL